MYDVKLVYAYVNFIKDICPIYNFGIANSIVVKLCRVVIINIMLPCNLHPVKTVGNK